MKAMIIGCCLCLFSWTILAQEQYQLTLLVENIEQVTGSVKACIVDQKEDFLSECVFSVSQKLNTEDCQITFENIPAGTYAVSLYHDENDDGELNSGMFRIPKEPYGFSNNPKSRFGPPDFEDCTFQVDGDKTLTIKL